MSQGEDAANLPGVKFTLLEKSLSSEFLRHFPAYVDGLVRGEPGGFVLTQKYADRVDDIYRLTVRPDDVWVVTFPKCGTTWTQDMVWMIMNNCDVEGAKEPLFTRSPFIEFPYLKMGPKEEANAVEINELVTLDMLDQMKSPRVLKSHLPFYLLPPQLVDTCKVVYVVRNPKDVIVSYFHHHRLIKLHTFTGTIEDFAEYFMKDELYYSPFFAHVFEGWAKRDNPNVLFLFYEDMKRNLRGEIEKVCKFLNKTLTEEQLKMLTDHLRFDNFSKNEAVNSESAKQAGFLHEEGHFIRKGKTGDWKNHFGPELNARIDKWIEDNLKGTDLKFTTELEHQD